MKLAWGLAPLFVLSLTACTTVADSSSGVRTLLVDNQMEYLDVASLVKTEASGFVTASDPHRGSVGSQDDSRATASQGFATFDRNQTMQLSMVQDARVASAIAWFYGTVPSDGQSLLRNEIQDHLVAASNQRCHRWKIYFSKSSEDFSFFSGTAGAIFSAVSTAVGAAGTKSALSAASSIAQGANSNYSEAYLQQKSLSVIYQGIDTRRANILNQIAKSRFGADKRPVDIQTYTLSAAIADALEYHSACSVISGLQQASEALAQQTPNPGTAALQSPATAAQQPPPNPGAKPAAMGTKAPVVSGAQLQ